MKKQLRQLAFESRGKLILLKRERGRQTVTHCREPIAVLYCMGLRMIHAHGRVCSANGRELCVRQVSVTILRYRAAAQADHENFLGARFKHQKAHHLARVLVRQRATIVEAHFGLCASIEREAHRAVFEVFDEKGLAVGAIQQTIKERVARGAFGLAEFQHGVPVGCHPAENQEPLGDITNRIPVQDAI
jgi:hypothetical protein